MRGDSETGLEKEQVWLPGATRQGLGAAGLSKTEGEMEVETEGRAPSFGPALFIIQSSQLYPVVSGCGLFVTFCAHHHQSLTTDPSLEVKHFNSSLCVTLCFAE